ncbi:MAG: SLC13 family permease [Schleiferiaceae bacterium]|nr:SLC13 family permease [Schleiferiaceae bacterium]
MDAHQIILSSVLLGVVVGLFFKKVNPVYLFGGAVLVLLLFGVISSQQLLSAMSNSAIATIFLLIFITSVLRQNFDVLGLFQLLFGRLKTPRAFLFGVNSFAALLSSVINNTPIVALLIPYLHTWGKRNNTSVSALLMPMAFAATVGGTITLIGTSTNLVLNGLLLESHLPILSTLDFFLIGLLITVVGVVYLSFFAPNLLVPRLDPAELFKNEAREYVVEILVEDNSKFVGKTVEEAGLRNLGGIFLIEIYRSGKLINPVQPRDFIQGGDLLYFVGPSEEVIDLVKEANGLTLPKTKKFQLGNDLDIVEALIPAHSNLYGKMVRESNFRERYDAAIIAIHRNGNRLGGKIGGTVLEPGDLLLLSAGPGFYNKIVNDKNLYSVSTINRIENQPKGIKVLFFSLSAFALIGVGADWWSFFTSLVTILGLGIAFGLTSLNKIKREFSPDLFVILVSSIVLGSALLQNNTVAWLLGDSLSVTATWPPFLLLVVLYGLTLILTSFVSNVAAVSIAFPIAIAIITPFDLALTPYMLAIAFGASCAFLTPVAYQTNLMVYGPGGYANKDFLKLGFPLTILYSLVCLVSLKLIYF